MIRLPTLLHRPGAFIAAGIAAWPVLAYSVANAAGVDGCVRAHGVVGFLATHGAMMRPTPACPSTAVGLPGVLDATMTVAAVLAGFMAVVHLITAAIGSGVVEWIHRVAEAIAKLIAPVLTFRRNALQVQLPPMVLKHRMGRILSIRMPWRRGPPVWGYAALS